MASRDGSVRIWDADTGTAIALLPGYGDATPIVNWAPDSSRVITTTTEAECRIWDSFTGEMLTRLGGSAPCGWYGAWWLGSERVLTLAARMVPHRADADLGVWDVASGSLLLRLGSAREPVRLAAQSADGTRFVTVARDRLGRLWDAASGRQVAAWATLLSEDLQAEAWSADLREAAFHLGDGTIRLWDMSVDVDTILGWAAQRVTRELTNAERQQFGLLDETEHRA
jgi:WD40 repeat protein